MVTRNIVFAPDEHYHIYNRGNSKQDIFSQATDYERFKALLYLANTTEHFNIRDVLKTHDDVFAVERPDTLVKIHSYCLISNHFHLLITPVTDKGLSKFLQKLATAYSMYFNTKYERSGSLFESRYKAKHADTDEYLKYLFAYIHLNPVRVEKDGVITYQNDAFARALQYPHSSLREYTGPRSDLGLVDRELFAGYFADQDEFEQELMSWIAFGEHEEPALGLT